jgi:hypothetical protein
MAWVGFVECNATFGMCRSPMLSPKVPCGPKLFLRSKSDGLHCSAEILLVNLLSSMVGRPNLKQCFEYFHAFGFHGY